MSLTYTTKETKMALNKLFRDTTTISTLNRVD